MADTKQTAARREIDSAGSRYALEVAFRTMQERCHKLQHRLSELEDENLRLRLLEMKEKRQSDGSELQMRSLKDEMARLELEKKQLSHHVYMVTSENKHLWNCLSHSKEANKALGNHLTRLSDTFTQHPLSGMAESQLNKKSMPTLLSHASFNRQSPVHTGGESEAKDSLEEISLKLINSFLQEKSELEDQCAQMKALHDDNMPVSFTTDNLSQSLLHDILNSENGASLALTNVKEHKSTLVQMKDDLLNQQHQLICAIDILNKMREERRFGQTCKMCAEDIDSKYPTQETALLNPEVDSSCQEKVTDSFSEPALNSKQPFSGVNASGTVLTGSNCHSCGCARSISNPTDMRQSSTPSRITSDVLDVLYICPMCSRSYPSSTDFPLFHKHVMTHFEPESFEYIEESHK